MSSLLVNWCCFTLQLGARATIVSDPLDKAAPCPTHAGGLPLVRTPWIEAGVLESLAVGRFWAQKRGMQPQPGPGNLIMTGEGRSLDERFHELTRSA